MTQFNLDKLNLFVPPSVPASSSRSPRAEAPGAFDEHLERASKSGAASTAPDQRRPESPVERPAPSQSDSRKQVEGADAPARQAESNQQRGDDGRSGAALPETPEETEAAGTSAAADETGAKQAEEESEVKTAGVDAELVAEVAAAALDENASAEARQASAESEQISPDLEAADADAEPKSAKPRRGLKKASEELPGRQPSGEQGEAVQEKQAERANAADHDAAAEEDAAEPSDARAVADQSRSLRDDRAAARRAAGQASQAAAEDPGIQATSKTADSADLSGLGAAANRLAGSESGVASARPAPAAVDGMQPAAEMATADVAGESEAGKAAAGPTGRTAAAAESRNQPPHASPADQVDRVRFVQRVAGALEAAHARGGHLRLRLHPPELGSLRLEISVQNGLMHARLEAESAAARNLLLDNLPALRERLAEMDVKIQQFDVELDMRSSGGPPQGPGDQQQGYDNPRRGDAPPDLAAQTQAETATMPAPAARPWDTSQFDVTV